MSDKTIDRSERTQPCIEESSLFAAQIDEQLTAVSSQCRRKVLIQLKRGEIESVPDLVSQEIDSPKQAEQRLFHTHLPKLADAGYIEWDRETGKIDQGAEFHKIIPVLELLETHSHFLRT